MPDFSSRREALKRHGIETSKQMCEALLRDTGVAFLPGNAFLRPEDEMSARMAFVPFDGESVLQSLKGITDPSELRKEVTEEFARKHCPNVYLGMEALRNWFSKL